MEAKDGSVGFDFEGSYTNIIEHQLIEYSFWDRSVTVRFEQVGDYTSVTVKFDPEDENSAEDQKTGWQAILNNFAKYVLSN
jgi:hypothetical protein